ncbi:MAG: diguanylate cyclase [Planctomycetales bacterium]|nr:diguanylate cyclase [Planctomycetales bacterium]
MVLSNRVLVLDDSPVTCKYVSQELEVEGYEVICVNDPVEALRVFQDSGGNDEAGFDLVLADWNMPEFNAEQFCRAIRNQDPIRYTYVIWLTPATQPSDIVTGLNLGADDCVTKPVDGDLLRARVRAGMRMLQLERQLRRDARCDALTGLLNRGTIMETISQEWLRAMRNSNYLSCVMVDVDRFKEVNDTYGHLAGDQVLVGVAKALNKSVRLTDFVGRFGGEEFILLLPQTTQRNAVIVAERCRDAIARRIFDLGVAGEIRVTASFGLSSNASHAHDADELLAAADEALLTAKRNGRNRVEQASIPCEMGMDSLSPLS